MITNPIILDEYKKEINDAAFLHDPLDPLKFNFRVRDVLYYRKAWAIGRLLELRENNIMLGKTIHDEQDISHICTYLDVVDPDSLMEIEFHENSMPLKHLFGQVSHDAFQTKILHKYQLLNGYIQFVNENEDFFNRESAEEIDEDELENVMGAIYESPISYEYPINNARLCLSDGYTYLREEICPETYSSLSNLFISKYSILEDPYTSLLRRHVSIFGNNERDPNRYTITLPRTPYVRVNYSATPLTFKSIFSAYYEAISLYMHHYFYVDLFKNVFYPPAVVIRSIVLYFGLILGDSNYLLQRRFVYKSMLVNTPLALLHLFIVSFNSSAHLSYIFSNISVNKNKIGLLLTIVTSLILFKDFMQYSPLVMTFNFRKPFFAFIKCAQMIFSLIGNSLLCTANILSALDNHKNIYYNPSKYDNIYNGILVLNLAILLSLSENNPSKVSMCFRILMDVIQYFNLYNRIHNINTNICDYLSNRFEAISASLPLVAVAVVIAPFLCPSENPIVSAHYTVITIRHACDFLFACYLMNPELGEHIESKEENFSITPEMLEYTLIRERGHSNDLLNGLEEGMSVADDLSVDEKIEEKLDESINFPFPPALK